MRDTSPALPAMLDGDKLAALRELAYGASHEINNPLANIAARAQTLLRDEVDPERRRMLEAIHHQSLRAHEMISDLMLFARPPQPQRRPCDLAELGRQTAEGLRSRCQQRGVRLDLSLPDASVTVDGDADQLGEAIRALLLNALEAVGIEGRLRVFVEVESAARGPGTVRIGVADNGRGMTPREAEHAFDPFFSGREAGRGLGFGLSKCWRIVNAHGGEVSLDALPDGGMVAMVTLPAAGHEAGASRAPGDKDDDGAGTPSSIR